MTRPDCVATVLAILADRDVWAEDRRALEAYVRGLETELTESQAREAYLREVLEAQPRRMAWVRIEGVDQELPDYATRLRDQALAAHQPGKPCARDDTRVLELALREVSLALDALAKECTEGSAQPQAPSRKSLMRARGLLPPYCEMALSKTAKGEGA